MSVKETGFEKLSRAGLASGCRMPSPWGSNEDQIVRIDGMGRKPCATTPLGDWDAQQRDSVHYDNRIGRPTSRAVIDLGGSSPSELLQTMRAGRLEGTGTATSAAAPANTLNKPKQTQGSKRRQRYHLQEKDQRVYVVCVLDASICKTHPSLPQTWSASSRR